MRKFIKLLFLLAWSYLIFILSSQPGEVSSTLSNGLLLKIAAFFRIADINAFLVQYATSIRKLAHFSEYFIFGFLVYITLEEFLSKKVLFVTLIICILYAISDEYHQMYVVGRVFGALDIFIDSVGAYCGSSLIHLLNVECFHVKRP